jgi:hypothetical protein
VLLHDCLLHLVQPTAAQPVEAFLHADAASSKEAWNKAAQFVASDPASQPIPATSVVAAARALLPRVLAASSTQVHVSKQAPIAASRRHSDAAAAAAALLKQHCEFSFTDARCLQ